MYFRATDIVARVFQKNSDLKYSHTRSTSAICTNIEDTQRWVEEWASSLMNAKTQRVEVDYFLDQLKDVFSSPVQTDVIRLTYFPKN